jgi:hypothetical protein
LIPYGAKLFGSAEQGHSRKGKRECKPWVNEPCAATVAAVCHKP